MWTVDWDRRIMDDVQFVWAQAEHAAVQAVDHVGCNHEESKPDQEQQKAPHPASQQDLADDFERFGYLRSHGRVSRKSCWLFHRTGHRGLLRCLFNVLACLLMPNR